MSKPVYALLALLALARFAQGADLARIERSLAREPTYKSKPSYCLLVFGPQARTRVWVVRDGDALYVDRNCDGDLTEKGERYAGAKHPDCIQWRVGDIVETDGTTRHTDLVVRASSGRFLLFLRTAGGVRQEVGNELGQLRFSEKAQDAPIVHLAGPLTFFLAQGERPGLQLIPGKESHFIALIGTAGLGEGTVSYCHTDDFGKLKMAMEVEFPRRAPAAPLRVHGAPGDPHY